MFLTVFFVCKLYRKKVWYVKTFKDDIESAKALKNTEYERVRSLRFDCLTDVLVKLIPVLSRNSDCLFCRAFTTSSCEMIAGK